MNLIDPTRTLVGYLRGPDVVWAEAKAALITLARAGLTWWEAGIGPVPVMAFPDDLNNDAALADWLEAQCRLCEGHSTGPDDITYPHCLIWPVTVHLLQKWLGA